MSEDRVRLFKSEQEWTAWLERNHDRSDGLWLRFAKKASGRTSVTYAQALDVALCYGWIDSQAKSEDERFYRQRFTPRRPRSVWSKRNREHVDRLIASGRMQAPGMAEVDRAKADGRWDAAYDSPSTATVPPDLEAALSRSAGARAAFEALKSQDRYAILVRLQTAKRADTRARRLAMFVRRLEDGEPPV